MKTRTGRAFSGSVVATPGEPRSLIVVDIDGFKQYNDHYGHMQGDQCLRQVARALDMAERCRKLRARAAVPHARSGVASVVTVSMGLGTIIPGEHDEAGAFLDMVDRRLYRAKAEGRDRVWSAEG